MRYIIVFALFLVALGTLRLVGCGDDCYSDTDCADGNDCSDEYCKYYPPSPYSGFSFCGPEFHACAYMRVENGTPCEADGQAGVCESGGCRLEGETPDGGVGQGGG